MEALLTNYVEALPERGYLATREELLRLIAQGRTEGSTTRSRFAVHAASTATHDAKLVLARSSAARRWRPAPQQAQLVRAGEPGNEQERQHADWDAARDLDQIAHYRPLCEPRHGACPQHPARHQHAHRPGRDERAHHRAQQRRLLQTAETQA